MRQRILRIGSVIVLVTLALVVAGAVYEQASRMRAAREFPPPGKMVDIGGRRIQMDCRGAGSPTVVFEAGFDLNGSLSWSAVHDDVARTTRACAYSRAGIMWSDAGDGFRNASGVAEDLHAALVAAGERPPFVMVGHSLGGPYAMIFTKRFGSEVAGLVFVDPSHPDQIQRLKTVTSYDPSSLHTMLKAGVAFAWSGAVRLSPMASKGAPREPSEAVRAMAAYAPTSLGALLKEFESMGRTLDEAGTFRQLGDRPVHVLSSMAPLSSEALAALKLTPEQGGRYKEIWKEMHDEEAAWSSRGRHRLVPDADHYIQFDRPDIVVEAVRAVVDDVRASH